MSEYVFDPFVGHKTARIFKLIATRSKAPWYDIKCENALINHKGKKVDYVSALHMTMSNEHDELVYVLSWHHYMSCDPEHKFRLSRHPGSKGVFYGNIQWEYRSGMVHNLPDLVKLCNQIIW